MRSVTLAVAASLALVAGRLPPVPGSRLRRTSVRDASPGSTSPRPTWRGRPSSTASSSAGASAAAGNGSGGRDRRAGRGHRDASGGRGRVSPFNGVIYVQVADIQASCRKATELGARSSPGSLHLTDRIAPSPWSSTRAGIRWLVFQDAAPHGGRRRRRDGGHHASERRKVEAGVLVPMVQAFERAFGKDAADAVARRRSRSSPGRTESAGRQFGHDLEGLARVSEVWSAEAGSKSSRWSDPLTAALQRGPLPVRGALQGTGAARARLPVPLQQGRGRVGAFGGRIVLKRTQTIMEGADHCDFRFSRRA